MLGLPHYGAAALSFVEMIFAEIIFVSWRLLFYRPPFY